MPTPPKTSVLMPMYNAQRYVALAINSILAQTFTDFEFIIVDDGSTDQSLDIVRRYERLDRRIRVLSRPNTGIVGALNDGLALAQGEYIARMDADDVAYPRRLLRQVAYLDDHPECVAVGSPVRCIDCNGKPTSIIYDVPLGHAEIESGFMLGDGGRIPHPTALLRRTALERIGGYRDFFPAEDADLFLRLAEEGTLANVPETLLDYRVHPDSVSHKTLGKGDLKGCVAAVEAHERRGIRIPRMLRRRYAKAAIALGDGQTARVQARLGLSERPFSGKSWRVLIASLFCDASPRQPAMSDVPASDEAPPDVVAPEPIQAIRIRPWVEAKGDQTLRLDYDLGRDSVVFDLGGYEGNWTSDIFGKYLCPVFVFEPRPDYARNIRLRFQQNPYIRVFDFGLAAGDGTISVSDEGCASSAYKLTDKLIQGKLRSAGDFLEEHQISHIHLLKINIEGGEYDLLDYLIATGWVKRIRDIQVQFHDFVPNAEARMKQIQALLGATHQLTYQYPFVWENWRLNNQAKEAV